MRWLSVCFAAVIVIGNVASAADELAAGKQAIVVQATEMKTTSGGPYPLVAGQTVTVEKKLDDGSYKIAVGPLGTIAGDALATPEAAMARFTKELETDPKNAAAWQARGILVFHQGKLKEAITDLDKAIELKPTSTAHGYRAFAWKRSGSKEKALTDFDEAIRLDATNALAWRVRGATYAGMADYPKALAGYTESIRLQPENTESLHHRVMLTSACNDAAIRNGKQAVADATKACELSEWKNTLYLSGLAAAQAESGDFDAAIATLEKGQKLMPANQPGRFDGQIKNFREKKPLRTTWR